LNRVSGLEGRANVKMMAGRPRTLYAQSWWITLAPSVLPRLLARS